MTLAAGTRLRHYEVRSLLGAGGMGEVYLATDTHLERPVALKILPEDVAADERRMSRFFQEAKSASALNHPNIVTVHEIGHEGDIHYFSTEYVDGETLRQRLKNAPLKLSETIDIATQVASALVAAHAAGIVHRDIKPENIMIRKDGYVKVLDFGLAKLMESPKVQADPEAATRTLVNTEPGAVMGTVAYMSPEQALGTEVDTRSDIWSLGVVMYEMAAGQVPFQGTTPSHVLVAITDKEPPPLRQYVPEIPEAFEWMVADALTKDREERTHSARELLSKLRRLKQRITSGPGVEHAERPSAAGENVSITSTPTVQPTGESAATPSADTAAVATMSSAEFLTQGIKSHKTAAAVVGLLIVLLLGGLVFTVYRIGNRAGEDRAPQPKFVQLTNGGKIGNASITGGASISPDGKYVAFLTVEPGTSIWVQQVLTGSLYRVLSPVEGSDYGPTAFSRDGEFIYYTQYSQNNPERVLYQIPVLGGPPKRVFGNIKGPPNFSPDGKQLAFIRNDEVRGESMLVVANSDGSGEHTLTTRQKPDAFPADGPSWSPDGKMIAVGMNHGTDFGTVIAVRVDDGAETKLTSQTWPRVFRVVWLGDGSGLLLTAYSDFASFGTQIWFLSYPDGEARRITNDLGGYGTFSLGATADGNTLVTVQMDWSCKIWAAPLKEDASHARRLTTGKYDGFSGIDVSAAGKIVYATKSGENPDLFIMNADGTGNKQLTSDPYLEAEPTFSPDGRFVVFASSRAGKENLWRIDVESGDVQQLTNGTGRDLRPSITEDGQWVIFTSSMLGTYNLWKVPMAGGAPVRLTDYLSLLPTVSPDGKLIALIAGTDPDKRPKLALITVDGGQPIKTFDFVSAGSGPELRWSPDSRSIIYSSSNLSGFAIWSQPIDGGKPVQLFSANDNVLSSFVLSRNGKEVVAAYGPQMDDIVLIKDFK